MKKGLSVLLVAAALFGFYGGAVNLNDVLACKDYWEEAGEKSTADMNRLEDGLNQLKDNEQAYLDGQVALEEGEKTLADGEAQYAQGLADYEAAPAKLAAGEAQLADGEDSYADLQKLIKGLKKAQQHGIKSTKTHDTYWHDGFTHTVSADVIAKMAAGEKTEDSPGLKQARTVITMTVNQKKDTLNTAAGLGGMPGLADKILAAKTYEQFDKAVASGVEPLKAAATQLNTLSGKASGAVTAFGPELNQAATLISSEDVRNEKINGLNTLKGGLGQAKAMGAATNDTKVADLPDAYFADLKAGIKANLGDGLTVGEALELIDANVTKLSDTLNLKREVAAKIGAAINELGGTSSLGMVSSLDEELGESLQNDLAVLTLNEQAQSLWSDDATFAETIGQFATDLGDLADKLKASAAEAQSTANTFSDWDDGYQTLAHAKDGKTSKAYPDDLASKSSGIPFAFKNMVTNKTIKAAVAKYDKSLAKELKKYTGNRLANEDMDDFDDDLVYICKKLIPRCLKVLDKVKADAAKQLAAGRAQLAQGRADYAAAPGKLADAEKQLADGRAQLAAGKDQLAQYEDGEQQVRDGLATLVGTEADLDLESILDRLNGDSDFDNGDEHLDIDEGLAAVEVGRGYQAEDGELITAEIMTRAIGTGGLLAAGVLAVLAAILSFLKKNKGAGVFAILAAAAGAFGAFEASQAGTYFSSIAGSTVGQTGMIAAGILAAVALVHSIVHFTAKKDA